MVGMAASVSAQALGWHLHAVCHTKVLFVLPLLMWKQVQRGQMTCPRPHSKRLTKTKSILRKTPSSPTIVSNVDEAWQELTSLLQVGETESQRWDVMFWGLWTPKPVFSLTPSQSFSTILSRQHGGWCGGTSGRQREQFCQRQKATVVAQW